MINESGMVRCPLPGIFYSLNGEPVTEIIRRYQGNPVLKMQYVLAGIKPVQYNAGPHPL
ncbi:MAG: hypothetical protein ABI688_01090 [Bacteroidota bacterium]